MQNLIRYFINLFDKISNRKVINELKKYFINDINVFFDVGGHHGETTIWFSKFFKIKKIYIFEPNFDIKRARLKAVFIEKSILKMSFN